MKKLLVILALSGCAATLPTPSGKAIVTHKFPCDVLMEGYDRDGNTENGPELVYLSYEGKTFALAEFMDGEEVKLKSLSIEVASGDVQVLTFEEVKALNLEPCSALFYSLQH